MWYRLWQWWNHLPGLFAKNSISTRSMWFTISVSFWIHKWFGREGFTTLSPPSICFSVCRRTVAKSTQFTVKYQQEPTPHASPCLPRKHNHLIIAILVAARNFVFGEFLFRKNYPSPLHRRRGIEGPSIYNGTSGSVFTTNDGGRVRSRHHNPSYAGRNLWSIRERSHFLG